MSRNSLPADQVRVVDVEDAYRQLLRKYSPHSVRRVHEFLRSTFAEAVRIGLVIASPMTQVHPPKKPPTDVKPPTPAQVSALLSAATGDERTMLHLAAATGARRGELVGLQWADLDIESCQLSIVRSLAFTKSEGVHERPTKTGKRGQRVITIDGGTVEMLRTMRSEQVTAAFANGLPSPVWMFSYDAGVTPWRPDRPTRIFTNARAAAKLAGFRFHDLRHFHATQLLASGIDVRKVAGRLGHTTTEQIYAHWIPGEDTDAQRYRGRRLVTRS